MPLALFDVSQSDLNPEGTIRELPFYNFRLFRVTKDAIGSSVRSIVRLPTHMCLSCSYTVLSNNTLYPSSLGWFIGSLVHKASQAPSIPYDGTIFTVNNHSSGTSNPRVHPCSDLICSGSVHSPRPGQREEPTCDELVENPPIVTSALLELSSLTLLICVLRAFQLILSVLRPCRSPREGPNGSYLASY